tara:strand:- start:1100 stop:1312 length:213 start_codon:yes stop_codon:yes gene_type:complete
MEKDMKLQEYFSLVQGNYQMLSEEEKQMLRNFRRTPEANIITKILGMNISGIQPEMKEQPEQKRMGLGSR